MKALILVGGSGTRLWPLSREKLPKQFLRLGGRGVFFPEDGTASSAGPFSGRPFLPITNMFSRWVQVGKCVEEDDIVRFEDHYEVKSERVFILRIF